MPGAFRADRRGQGPAGVRKLPEHHRKIYWSALGSDRAKDKEIAKGLRSSAAFLRRRLASVVNLRETPELTFVKDNSFENGAHIDSLLREIGADGGEKGGGHED